MANVDAFNSGFDMGMGKKSKKSKSIKNPAAKTSSGLADPPAYKKGGKVKKTGWAKVHKHETILTASQSKGRTKKRGKKSARKKITKR
jgi:hypothetical protein